MIKNQEFDTWLDQMLTLGESFKFVNGIVKDNAEYFQKWLNNSVEFLVKNEYVTKDKLQRSTYQNDEDYYGLVVAWLRKVYIDNSGIW